MILRPFKYVLVAVALEVDEDGHPVAEHASQETVVYGKENLFAAIEAFESSLKSTEEESRAEPDRAQRSH